MRLMPKTIKIETKAEMGGGSRKSFNVRNDVVKTEYLKIMFIYKLNWFPVYRSILGIPGILNKLK